MSIGPYNGWTAEERLATLPRLRAALRSGLLQRPAYCSICGFRDGSDPTGSNYTTWHDERYDILAPYAVCRRDHSTLHRRFERPRPWLRLVTTFGDGTKWFEMLAMDPASMTSLFRETYPNGLPYPEDVSGGLF
jgi:hypothetical protein